ncbi:hypothetical protein H0A71_12240 [Alcaligenaceae bacterium]|nr:hypothetical protein [Alcaligenaceae bacterium]
MAAGYLTAFEYQTLRVGDNGTLTVFEAHLLQQIGVQRPGFCRSGHRTICLAQYAGLVNLGGRILEVLPKVGEQLDASLSRNTLLRLLCLAYDIKLAALSTVDHLLQRHALLDIFTNAFLAELSRLVRGGLVRRYQTEEDDLTLVRGRLNIARQVSALANRPDRIACRFDTLTADNSWNQVLKAALTITRSSIINMEIKRKWSELISAFDEVSTCTDGLRLSAELIPDRHVQHYGPAMRWAKWILQLLSPSLRAGSATAPALLFDMNQLFEQAVAKHLLRRVHRQGWRLSVQDTGYHLAHSADFENKPYFGLRPDLVLRNGPSVIAIGDTKWATVKMDERNRLCPPADHIYQLHAYATAYRCPDLALIYPSDGSDALPQATAFRLPTGGDISAQVHVLRVDVSKDGLPLMGAHRPNAFASIMVDDGKL